MRFRITVGVFAVALTALSCGTSAPPVPTSPAPATSAFASTPFGVGATDLASCLGGSRDSSCFSATRLRALASGAATAPGAPSGLTASVAGQSVTLTWTAPASGDPVVSYVLEAGSTSGASNLANISTSSTATSYSTSGVPAGTYFVRVRAQNSAGPSGASNEVTVVVGTGGCTSAPGAPTGLTASVSGTTLTLTWNAPAGPCAPTSYGIQAGTGSGLSNVATLNTGNTQTTFSASGVPVGTYFVRVVSTNGNGSSGASNEVIATVGGTAPTPGTSLAGLVTDASSGAPIAGVAVSVQGQNATTGADGRYSISSLTAGSASATAQHQGHRNFTQTVTLSGATTLNIAMTPAIAAGFVGNWSGQWADSTFATSGSTTMTLSVDTIAQTGQLSIDLNGGVYGAGNPPAESVSGSYTTTGGGTFTKTSTFYGNISFTISPTGQISGSAVSPPVNTSISRTDFAGTITSSSMNLSYTVRFTSGSTAVGTVTLTKQ